jgi:hypothetical protein
MPACAGTGRRLLPSLPATAKQPTDARESAPHARHGSPRLSAPRNEGGLAHSACIRRMVLVYEDMTDEELAKELERYADGLVGGPLLKGLPRTKAYSGDRENEEREVTRLVLKHLGYPAGSLIMEPWGAGTIPDVEAALPDGRSIGVEVTELLDQHLRHRRIKRREEERRLGLSQLQAFKCEVDGNNPTPHHVSRFATAQWTADKLRQEIERAIAGKDQKAEAHRRNGLDFGRYAEMVLAIFTGEEVTADLIATVRGHGPFRSSHFHRVVVVMDYDPQGQNNPVLVL